MTIVDMWDDAGAFHYRNLPEMRLSQFFTEERDMLRITQERDGWWLADSRNSMQDCFKSLELAKDAGDREIARLERTQDDALLTEAGLSGDAWKVDYGDGVSFEQKDGTFSISAYPEKTPKWTLFDGDLEIVKGTVQTVVEMASRMMQS